MLGPSPWRGNSRKLVLIFGTLGVVGSAVGVIYTRTIDAQDRRFTAGLAAMRTGDYKEARSILKQTTQTDPSNEMAFYELGNAHWMLGENAEALAAWTSALRIDPDMVPALVARGIQLFNNGEMDASLQDFQRAIAVKPTMEAYLQQGLALQKLGRYREALESLDESWKLADSSDSNHRQIDTARQAIQRDIEKTKSGMKP